MKEAQSRTFASLRKTVEKIVIKGRITQSLNCMDILFRSQKFGYVFGAKLPLDIKLEDPVIWGMENKPIFLSEETYLNIGDKVNAWVRYMLKIRNIDELNTQTGVLKKEPTPYFLFGK